MQEPVFPIHSVEPLRAFVSRLACSKGRTLEQFRGDTGIVVDQPSQWPTTLEYLSRMTGVHVKTLSARGASRVRGTAAYELVPPDHRWIASPRFCPRCLVADMRSGWGKRQQRPWMREHWHLRAVEVCETHLVPIARLSNYASHQADDFSNAVLGRWAEIENLAERAPRRVFEGVDRYFSSRYQGHVEAGGLLNTLQYGDAFSLSQLVGAMDLLGNDIEMTSMSEEQSRSARVRGFDIVTDHSRFETFLDARNGLFQESETRFHWSRIYGALHRVVIKNIGDPTYAALAQTLRHHAMKHHPIGPPDRFLGLGGTRNWHSVESLSVDRDIDPDLLREALFDAGVLGRKHRSKINPLATFKVTEIETLPEDVFDGVTEDFVLASLGITLTRVRQLVGCGMLSVERALADADDRYSKSEVLGLGARAYSRALPMQPTDTLVSISAAAFETKSSYDEIVRMILAGTLRTVGFFETRQGSGDLGRILVDVAEVEQVASRLIPRQRTPKEAAACRVREATN